MTSLSTNKRLEQIKDHIAGKSFFAIARPTRCCCFIQVLFSKRTYSSTLASQGDTPSANDLSTTDTLTMSWSSRKAIALHLSLSLLTCQWMVTERSNSPLKNPTQSFET